MNRTHLSDERLIELSIAGGDGTKEAHLAQCRRCETRFAELASMMTDVSTVLVAEADAAFPAERLAKQHARILQHIEIDGRPARIIEFPAAHVSPIRTHRRPARRWIAAAGAIAASFVVGILADHLTHDMPAARTPTPRLAVRTADQNPSVRTIAASMSDDELLGQIEAAVGSTGPASLRALDAMTPRAWDVR